MTVEPRNRFIGIDDGGTKIVGVVADAATGEIDARHKVATPKDDRNKLPIAINDVVAALIEETGNVLISASGHSCACGKIGCWESVASGARVVELAGNKPAHIRGEHVAAAMAEGDPGAEEVTKRFVQWVADGLVNLIALLDPEIIVLGGGLTVINRSAIHGAGTNVTADRRRMANLLQISSVLGRSIEAMERKAMWSRGSRGQVAGHSSRHR